MFKKFFLVLFVSVIYIESALANLDVKARTAILQDYYSGEILYEKEPDISIYPASMTKIMTAIIAFDLIKSGDLKLDEKFIISEKAWRLSTSGYSSMFIMVGDQVSVENLLRGIIVASGNDACVALAEGIAGTEEEFAILMTAKAKEIGMENTNFSNSSGINDPDNYSTVRDVLKMSRYLIQKHPDFYEWFSLLEFTWDRTGGDPITQGNRNPLLYKNLGADGFKTKNSRSRESSKLLTYGLTNFDLVKINKSSETIDKVDVWLGKENQVDVYVNEDIFKTIKKAKKNLLKVALKYEGPIEAPIKKDDVIGKYRVIYDEELIGEYDLLAAKDVDKVNVFTRLIKSLNYLIWGDV